MSDPVLAAARHKVLTKQKRRANRLLRRYRLEIMDVVALERGKKQRYAADILEEARTRVRTELIDRHGFARAMKHMHQVREILDRTYERERNRGQR